MTRVAYYTKYQDWLNDRMFDLSSSANRNNVLERYLALRDYLARQDISLHSYDRYKPKDVDVWLVSDISPSFIFFMLKNKIPPKKIVPLMIEPPIINVWGWRLINLYKYLFPAVLTWNSDLCAKNINFFHFHFPVSFDEEKYNYYVSKPKKGFALMMHSDKYSNKKGELYSLRRKIISYFEKRGDNLLDLYGKRWNSHKFKTTIYRGTTEDKLETYSQYYFSFCIDNSIVPGYITYDPLISMSVGTVPIYLPMPDSTKFIPEETFIDFSKFKDLDELTLYLKDFIKNQNYELCRKNGIRFLKSQKYYPFTVEKYCEDFYQAIRYVMKKNEVL